MCTPPVGAPCSRQRYDRSEDASSCAALRYAEVASTNAFGRGRPCSCHCKAALMAQRRIPGHSRWSLNPVDAWRFGSAATFDQLRRYVARPIQEEADPGAVFSISGMPKRRVGQQAADMTDDNASGDRQNRLCAILGGHGNSLHSANANPCHFAPQPFASVQNGCNR